jgi:hypothetical protein
MVFKVNELLLIQQLVPRRNSQVLRTHVGPEAALARRPAPRVPDSIERSSAQLSGDAQSRRRADLGLAKPAGQRRAE